MPAVERILADLRGRGELWQARPGLIGMRGDLLTLFRGVEAAVARLARTLAPDEWHFPAGLALETLARAGYFESFPQWLTVASHLSDAPEVLEQVARDVDPAGAARAAVMPAEAALPPAVCYHAYAALAGVHLTVERRLTAQGTCWRHERQHLEPLARGWAFTMREIICIGSGADVEHFRSAGRRAAVALAQTLGLEPDVAVAEDPFFAPTSRGRALLQRMKCLKEELLLPLGERDLLAAASFNHHERFFGEAFDIRLPDGSPAESGCVAFGLERWVLGVLAAHGADPRRWPAALNPPPRADLSPGNQFRGHDADREREREHALPEGPRAEERLAEVCSVDPCGQTAAVRSSPRASES